MTHHNDREGTNSSTHTIAFATITILNLYTVRPRTDGGGPLRTTGAHVIRIGLEASTIAPGGWDTTVTRWV